MIWFTCKQCGKTHGRADASAGATRTVDGAEDSKFASGRVGLQYGSGVMNVTGDRTVEHGLATIGYDDEGVAGQSWDLITGGILTGYQLDRRMARSQGFGRSNGCG